MWLGDFFLEKVTGFAVYEGHYPVEQLAEVVVRELIR